MNGQRLDWRLTGAGVAGLVFLAAFAIDVPHPKWQLLVDLTVAGVVVGGIFSLSAIGLVITYTATGVFNFAHGAIAILVAYVLWQLVRVWELPLGVAAPVALLVVGPAIGVVLEVAVFRPLQRRGAGVAELIVSSVGLFVLIVGTAFLVWGPETKNDPVRLFPSRPVGCGGPCRLPGTHLTITLGTDQLGVIGVVAALSLTLWLLLRKTFLGTQVRAVVDRRDLAELSAIDAGRVAAISWAVGTALAGLTGVLLAPITFGLDPFRLTLLVTETFAVAVLARLVSVPLAVGGGLFLGLLLSFSNVFSFARPAELLGASASLGATIGDLFDPILTSISVFVLFGTLLLNRRLDDVGDPDRRGFVGRAAVGGFAASPMGRPLATAALGMALVAPALIPDDQWRNAHTMLALVPVLLSIVVVSGFSGHITLGQAGFAGFGAFVAGRLHAGTLAGLPAFPAVLAMIAAALACVPLGLAAGWPAARRRGLFLALTTLALGLVLERYIFQNFYLASPEVLDLNRPSLFGLSLQGNAAFWWYELAVVVVAVYLTWRAREGRVGRVLAALRDSEPASTAIGIDVRRAKLFVFSLGALLAGMGGVLLGETARTFSADQFISFNSLVWFAAVVVSGMTSIAGALVAAFILTMLAVVAGEPGLPLFVIGVAAVALGHLPGGIVGAARRFLVFAEAPAGPPARPAGRRLRPTPLARALLSRQASR